jgi:hypothetical protein
LIIGAWTARTRMSNAGVGVGGQTVGHGLEGDLAVLAVAAGEEGVHLQVEVPTHVALVFDRCRPGERTRQGRDAEKDEAGHGRRDDGEGHGQAPLARTVAAGGLFGQQTA